MDAETFVKLFLTALSDDQVVKKLQNGVVLPLEIEINNLKESNSKILCEIEGLKLKDAELQGKVNKLEDKMEHKEKEVTIIDQKLAELEIMLDKQDQQTRRNNLRIQGLPENMNEDLDERIRHLLITRMDLEMEALGINNIYRIGQKKIGTTTRDVMVKFTSYEGRKTVYKARKGLRKPGTPEDEFDPEITPGETEEENHDDTENDEGDEETDNPYQNDVTQRGIFINEDLTKRRSNLLYQARKLKKEKKINDCWSYDGKVMLKNNVNKIEPVTSNKVLATYQ